MNKQLLALAPSLVLLCCASPRPRADSLSDQQQDMLVAVETLEGVHLVPQVNFETRLPDYSLGYVLSEDGSSVETRYLGSGETLGTALSMKKYDSGD